MCQLQSHEIGLRHVCIEDRDTAMSRIEARVSPALSNASNRPIIDLALGRRQVITNLSNDTQEFQHATVIFRAGHDHLRLLAHRRIVYVYFQISHVEMLPSRLTGDQQPCSRSQEFMYMPFPSISCWLIRQSPSSRKRKCYRVHVNIKTRNLRASSPKPTDQGIGRGSLIFASPDDGPHMASRQSTQGWSA